MLKARGHSVEINRETCEFYEGNNTELNQANSVYSVINFGFAFWISASNLLRVLVLCMPHIEHMVF